MFLLNFVNETTHLPHFTQSKISLTELLPNAKHEVDDRVDPAINKTGPCTPRALPKTPRMLELTAEPLNYN